MGIAKIVLLAGAMLGATASYVLAGRPSTPIRTISAAALVALLVTLVINLAAHFGALSSALARPLIAGFGAVFATMIALSRVVLAPLHEKHYLAAVLYGASAFLVCSAIVVVAVRFLP
jgi:fluoride ion exporter CrcB/FEX